MYNEGPSAQYAADRLNDAADLIDRHGWIQGTFGNPKEGFCAIGALGHSYREADALSMKNIFKTTYTVQFLRDVIGDYTEYEGVMGWNDAPDRTKDEVTTALREAAKNAQKIADTQSPANISM